MYYDHRAFNFSLLISTSFHVCIAIIFFFISFTHQPFTTIKPPIEVSLVKLPEEEPKPEVLKKLEPKIKKKRIIPTIKERPKFKKGISPHIQKPIASTPRLEVTQKVKEKEITPPIAIPPTSVGIERDKPEGNISVPTGVPDENIKEGKKEEDLALHSATNVIKKDREEEEEGIIGPYIHISGPAGKRKALYKPKFNPPYWLEKTGQSIRGKLKIWVLPDGSVDKVEIEESFGYAEIDRLAYSTVYKWRFYKLPPDVKRVDWGIVTIVIRLE